METINFTTNLTTSPSQPLNIISQPLNTNLTTSPSHHLTIKSHHLTISTSQHNKKWNIFYT